MAWRFLDYGPHDVLVEVDGPDDVVTVLRALDGAPGVQELVPAERTVLVRAGEARIVREAIAERLSERWDDSAVDQADDGAPVVIDVDYNGADLDEVAIATGLTVAQVVQRHASPTYRVAFCGFAPGFAYLIGLDEGLVLPRRSRPRTVVPVGSVAIASRYTAVYPQSSPGGWHLIGHTDASMWDVTREHPALLAPGVRVRFRPLDSGTSAAGDPVPR